MYGFILNMWIMERISAEKVQSYVPKYITQAQCNMILATPQNPSQLESVKLTTTQA